MGYFPMCVDIAGKPVILVGDGAQIREKIERLAPFGPRIIRVDRLTQDALREQPAFVIAGDLPEEEAEAVAALCARHRVPLNVVDVPRLCTFAFPSLIVQGDLTISLSTGGRAPGVAAYLKEQIAQRLPEDAEGMLDWLAQVRTQLKKTHPAGERAKLMRRITAAAFTNGRALSEQELLALMDGDVGLPIRETHTHLK